MKTVIYSTQASGFEADAEYRNPRFFRAPLGKPDLVKVVGDWPDIVAAYEAVGVTVETDAPKAKPAPKVRKKTDAIHDDSRRDGGGGQ